MTEKPNHLLLVDGHNLLFRAFYGMPSRIVTPNGTPVHAVYGFAAILLKTIREISPDCACVCFDAEESSFRYEQNPDYKAQRVPITGENNPFPQLPKVKLLLHTLHIPFFEQSGVEADDVLGSLATRAARNGLLVTIVSNDKDMLQLVNERVRVYMSRGKTRTLYTVEETYRRFGLYPSQIVDFKALKGDPSDNVIGVPGIGEKRATVLLQAYGNIENAYDNLADVKSIPGFGTRIARDLDRYRQRVLENRRLITVLTDLPIDFEPENHPVGASISELNPRDLLEELAFL